MNRQEMALGCSISEVWSPIDSDAFVALRSIIDWIDQKSDIYPTFNRQMGHWLIQNRYIERMNWHIEKDESKSFDMTKETTMKTRNKLGQDMARALLEKVEVIEYVWLSIGCIFIQKCAQYISKNDLLNNTIENPALHALIQEIEPDGDGDLYLRVLLDRFGEWPEREDQLLWATKKNIIQMLKDFLEPKAQYTMQDKALALLEKVEATTGDSITIGHVFSREGDAFLPKQELLQVSTNALHALVQETEPDGDGDIYLHDLLGELGEWTDGRIGPPRDAVIRMLKGFRESTSSMPTEHPSHVGFQFKNKPNYAKSDEVGEWGEAVYPSFPIYPSICERWDDERADRAPEKIDLSDARMLHRGPVKRWKTNL